MLSSENSASLILKNARYGFTRTSNPDFAISHHGEAGYLRFKANPARRDGDGQSRVRVRVIRNGHSQIKDALFSDEKHGGIVEESAHF